MEHMGKFIKQKIMVFRQSGRFGLREKWCYQGEQIEIVNSQKYLGVTFTSNISRGNHTLKKEPQPQNTSLILIGTV